MSKKNFCLLQLLIVFMLVICLLANTLAWSNPDPAKGDTLILSYSAPSNGRSASVSSTVLRNGDDDTVISDDPTEITVPPGTVLDFETVVVNPEDGEICNVSLFLRLPGDDEPRFDVQVASPTRELRHYSGSGSSEYAGESEWYRVVTSCEIVSGDEVTFEWSLILVEGGTIVLSNDNIVLEFF